MYSILGNTRLKLSNGHPAFPRATAIPNLHASVAVYRYSRGSHQPSSVAKSASSTSIYHYLGSGREEMVCSAFAYNISQIEAENKNLAVYFQTRGHFIHDQSSSHSVSQLVFAHQSEAGGHTLCSASTASSRPYSFSIDSVRARFPSEDHF